MFVLYLLLFLASPILLLLSLLSPKIINQKIKQKFTRKQYAKIFLGSTALFFLLLVATVPESTGQSTQTSTTTQGDNSEDEILYSQESSEKVLGTQEQEKEEGKFLVTKISDGDTIWVNNDTKVRYIGINTPELKPQNRPTDCKAREAVERNKELVMGKLVRLEKDVSETDRYDRLLRYIWVDDVMINEVLVKEGLAESSAYPPDTKYQERFDQAEKEAKENKRGIWSYVCTKPTPTPIPITTPAPKPTIIPTSIPTTTPQPYIPPPTQAPVVNTSPFSCSCSKTCGQMASCEEAYYQLNTCGCGARDGDDDGVPCESICN